MSNGVSLRKAALNHGINYQTLSYRFNRKHNKPNGRQTKLPAKVEDLLVHLFADLSDIGFCLAKKEVLVIVNNFVKESNMCHLFPENGPTDEWYKSFMNRHKDTLATKYLNNAPLNRACQSTLFFLIIGSNFWKKSMMSTISMLNRLTSLTATNRVFHTHPVTLKLCAEKVYV